jgi:hypothetical protein
VLNLESMTAILSFIDRHDWLVTLAAGLIAVYLYIKARLDARRDAAKLILQEMRYADQKVRHYKTYNSYLFTEKILPTNSWHKNISLFIRKLNESEIDLISKFFSNATYLDEVIKSIADKQNARQFDSPPTIESGPPVAVGTGELATNDPARKIIEAISRDIESVYNTPAADKLRKLADKRWYYPI